MELAKEARRHFLYWLFFSKEIFKHLLFISIYSALNALSEYTYFTSKYTNHYFIHFLLVFKIVESLQCKKKVDLHLSDKTRNSCKIVSY